MIGLASQELEDVIQMGVDETSSQKGYKYLTILADTERKKVVGVSEGRTGESLISALEEMEIRGASRKSVKCVIMDISKSYLPVVGKEMSQAKIVFDRFHLAFNLNKEVDRIRIREVKKYNELKSTKYIWLKNNINLNDDQRAKLDMIEGMYLDIGTAYRFKELFREVLDHERYELRLKPLNDRQKTFEKVAIPKLTRFVNLLKMHWYDIKKYFTELTTIAFEERVNLNI